jgi:hypothetical protein
VEVVISNRERLRNLVAGQDVVLRGVSALEYMDLFVGYMAEQQVEVYLRVPLDDNFDSTVVDCFEKIDYFIDNDVRCSTLNQVVNDMLSDYNTMDSAALAEALSEYHELNGSFDGININPENLAYFREMQDWALEFHEEM